MQVAYTQNCAWMHRDTAGSEAAADLTTPAANLFATSLFKSFFVFFNAVYDKTQLQNTQSARFQGLQLKENYE